MNITTENDKLATQENYNDVVYDQYKVKNSTFNNFSITRQNPFICNILIYDVFVVDDNYDYVFVLMMMLWLTSFPNFQNYNMKHHYVKYHRNPKPSNMSQIQKNVISMLVF